MTSFDDGTYGHRPFVLIRSNEWVRTLIRLSTFALTESNCKLSNSVFMPLGKRIKYRYRDMDLDPHAGYSHYARGRVWAIDAICDPKTGLHIDIIRLPPTHISIVY